MSEETQTLTVLRITAILQLINSVKLTHMYNIIYIYDSVSNIKGRICIAKMLVSVDLVFYFNVDCQKSWYFCGDVNHSSLYNDNEST